MWAKEDKESNVIDVVITWVDGSDPVIEAKRNQYLEQAGQVPQISKKERRFSHNGEIKFCLQSIATHATWVRHIYLITDGQVPSCIENKDTCIAGILHKIRIIDHTEIFAGHESLLPTFNSLSIETFLWRINGLSEYFLYLNDDIFFTGRLQQEDFFIQGKAALRGKWSEWETGKKLTFHAENNRQGAAFSLFNKEKFFKAVHVAHPLRKSIFEAAYAENPEIFEKNASYRFRSRKQFWPISLHNHRAFNLGMATIKNTGSDCVHFSVDFCRDAEPSAIKKRLSLLKKRRVKQACINYMEAVSEKVPEVMSTLESVTSPRCIQKIINKIKRHIRS